MTNSKPEGLCGVCFNDFEDCICPECPTCAEHGQEVCYKAHGLLLSRDQMILRTERALVEAEQTVENIGNYQAWLMTQPEEATFKWNEEV